MLLPKSSCVCAPWVKSVAPRVCLAKVSFLAFFQPDMKTEMGVVIYMNLKHSPDYFDSKYIWIQVSNSQGSSVVYFADIPFLAFFALHSEKRCGQVGTSQCYSESEVVYAYQDLNL